MSMLEIHKLSMDLRDSEHERSLLRSISLEVDSGESLGLVGESGSGKSLTLKSILRVPPGSARISGSVLFNGSDVLSMNRKELRNFRATNVAMIAQNPHGVLNPVLTIQQFMLEGMSVGGKHTRREALRMSCEVLEDVGIRDVMRVMKSYPHELSGGMLQRVVIAAAIAAGPSIILADEPTTALDVTTQAEVVAILDELRRDRGLAMIFVTHDLDLAAAMCGRIAVMKQGEIVEQGSVEHIYEGAQHDYTKKLMSSKPELIHWAESE